MQNTYENSKISNKLNLSISQISQHLSISQATVRNWMRLGIISKNINFDELKNIEKKLETGEIKRLNHRANKTRSTKIFIPVEYAGSAENIKYLKQIIKFTKKYFSDIDEAIFNFVSLYVKLKLEAEKLERKNKSIILSVIYEYSAGRFLLNQGFILQTEYFLKKIIKNDTFDFIGLFYQSIFKESNKSILGSYYTPIKIIEELIDEDIEGKKKLIDPACGTGAFLLKALTRGYKTENIYGIDIDKNAVFIAKINILLSSPHYQHIPKIFNTNALTEEKFDNFFDIVVTNPPWGRLKNEEILEKYSKHTHSKELFSMFLVKACKILNNKGELKFLLPESILKIKYHRYIREFLLKNCKLVSIKEYGRVFSGVYSSVISLCARKKQADFENRVFVKTLKSVCYIEQGFFLGNENSEINLNIDSQTRRILEKVYSIRHITLKNNALWALGIVTGNNQKYISSIKQKNYEPIYIGKDILPFTLKKASHFIDFRPELYQQVAPIEYYRAEEKLVYKFISNRLVFAYDNKRYLTLNSANILIPKMSGYSTKVVLAFLNSDIFRFIFSKKFSTHKILRSDLEKLPFPEIDQSIHNELEYLVEKMIEGEAVEGEINSIINGLFGFGVDAFRL